MNDHNIYFIKFKSILNVVETIPKWHDIAQKPKINLSTQCVIYVQGVASKLRYPTFFNANFSAFPNYIVCNA